MFDNFDHLDHHNNLDPIDHLDCFDHLDCLYCVEEVKGRDESVVSGYIWF